jgi:hypothetical protein
MEGSGGPIPFSRTAVVPMLVAESRMPLDARIDVAVANRPARRPGSRARGSLSCSRCGLVMHERPPWIDPVDCPRCLAYADTHVRLVVGPTPAAQHA